MSEKIIVVEGKTDKLKLQKILAEPVRIVCTYGTLSEEKLEQIIWPLQDEEVYILVDADESGNKLRSQLKQELPNARQLYTRSMYGEVANTPETYLAALLLSEHFLIDEQFLSPE
jgi:toprim domain protein